MRRAPLRSLLAGGLVYFALFVVVHAILAAGPDLWSGLDVLLLLLVAGPQLLLVVRRRLDLGRRLATAVCASAIAAAAIGVWTLPPGAGDSSYAAWFLGAITFNLLGLTLVGRYAAAWLTMLVVVGIAVTWSLLTGFGAGPGAGLVVRHVGTLVVGTALAVSLRRSSAAFGVARAVERVRRAEEQALRASTDARRAAAERVLVQAGPTLEAIRSGRQLSEEDRRDLRVLEGALRDEIRTPDLVAGRLRVSVDAARRRGVNVLLMDEATGRGPARESAVAWLADRLDDVRSGGFVGRLREGDGGLRVSAVADGQGSTATFSG